MKYVQTILLAGLAATIGSVLAPSLQADTWNKKTMMTITEPMQVPSCCTPDHTVILPPGDYVMVLVDSLSDRHIVRIFAKDEKTVMTTILAIPNYRLQPTGKTVFQFWEVPAGQPVALRAWFYPGDNFGQEFAYPKQRAIEIAAFVKTPVPAIEVETAAVEELKTAPLVAVDETGRISGLVATMPARTPEPEPTVAIAAVQAPVQTPPPAETVVVQTPAPAEVLPSTASNLPLIGLAGLVALGLFAALEIRSRRRRTRQV
jgi:hypothetical protein